MIFENKLPSRFANQLNGKPAWENYKQAKQEISEDLFSVPLLDQKNIEEQLREIIEEIFDDFNPLK